MISGISKHCDKFLVLRLYTWHPVFMYGESIIKIVNLLNGLNKEKPWDTYIRSNIYKDSTEKKLGSEDSEKFSDGIKNNRILNFQFYGRQLACSPEKAFPFCFRVMYDNYKYYLLEAFNNSPKSKTNPEKLKKPATILRVDLCINTECYPEVSDEKLFDKIIGLFSELFSKSEAVYGYITLMDWLNGVFCTRSLFERKLGLGRDTAESYGLYTAGSFWGNFITGNHISKLAGMEYLKGNNEISVSGISDKALFVRSNKKIMESPLGGSEVEKLLKITYPSRDSQVLFPLKLRYAYVLNEEQVKSLGGLEVLKKFSPGNIIELDDGTKDVLMINQCEYAHERDYLIDFLWPLMPFRLVLINSPKGKRAEKLVFLYEAGGSASVNITHSPGLKLSGNVEFSLFILGKVSEKAFEAIKVPLSEYLSGSLRGTGLTALTDVISFTADGELLEDEKLVCLYRFMEKYANEHNLKLYLYIGELPEGANKFINNLDLETLMTTF